MNQIADPGTGGKIEPENPRTPATLLAELSDRCAILIPALNEEASVGEIVHAIQACGLRNIVVIADGCSDNTAEAARLAGATVIELPIRLGAWGAIQTGMRFALSHQFEYAITMDADGQHNPQDLQLLLDTVVREGFDVAIGACTRRGSYARKIAWRYLKRISALRLEDITSGFRAYNRRALELLTHRRATLLDYQDVGVLILLLESRLEIGEVEVEMELRSDGHSRIFHSWIAVAYYMYHTTILSLSKALRSQTGCNRVPGDPLKADRQSELNP